MCGICSPSESSSAFKPHLLTWVTVDFHKVPCYHGEVCIQWQALRVNIRECDGPCLVWGFLVVAKLVDPGIQGQRVHMFTPEWGSPNVQGQMEGGSMRSELYCQTTELCFAWICDKRCILMKIGAIYIQFYHKQEEILCINVWCRVRQLEYHYVLYLLRTKFEEKSMKKLHSLPWQI